jgi:hypothetical protein
MTKYSESDFHGLSSEFIKESIVLLIDLDESLVKILTNELASGNKIGHVSKGWPSKNGILVQLIGKMNLKVSLPDNVQYKHVNDPHYWIHEFTTYNGSNQEDHDILICNEREI